MSGFKSWLCHLLAMLLCSPLVSLIICKMEMMVVHPPCSLLYALHKLVQVKHLEQSLHISNDVSGSDHYYLHLGLKIIPSKL